MPRPRRRKTTPESRGGDGLRSEGGSVHLKQSHDDAAAPLSPAPGLDLEGGYAFHYFTQRERSREDGNYFKLWNNDVTLELTYRF